MAADLLVCPRKGEKHKCEVRLLKYEVGEPLSEEKSTLLRSAISRDYVCRHHTFSIISDYNLSGENARQLALDSLVNEKDERLRIMLMLYLTSQHDGRVLKYVITELENKAKLLEKGPNTQSYEKGVRYASCLVTALNTFKNEDFSGIHALEMFCTALGEYSRGDLYNEATRLFFELFERYSKTFRAEALTPHTY